MSFTPLIPSLIIGSLKRIGGTYGNILWVGSVMAPSITPGNLNLLLPKAKAAKPSPHTGATEVLAHPLGALPRALIIKRADPPILSPRPSIHLECILDLHTFSGFVGISAWFTGAFLMHSLPASLSTPFFPLYCSPLGVCVELSYLNRSLWFFFLERPLRVFCQVGGTVTNMVVSGTLVLYPGTPSTLVTSLIEVTSME